MTPEFLAKTIGLSEEATAAAFSLDIPHETEAVMRAAYDKSQDDFAAEVNKTDDPNLWVLALYLKWGAESYDKWHAAGIPDEIYFDTFKDITIWCNRCLARTGKIGLIEWPWFIVHIGMRLFRLGRLQFEPGKIYEEITLPDGTVLPKDMPVLGVHIPRGDGFNPETIKASFEWAKEFFPKYFGTSYDTYVCTSWMLAPQLDQLISENSSIAYFRKYFTIYGEDTSYSQAEDYVFLKKLDDKTQYAEDTSLQRNLKKFLLDGGVMGMGKAVGKF